jgi:ribosome biogenesis GTPase
VFDPSHALARLGWDEGFAISLDAVAPGRTPARITRVDRGTLTAAGADGELRLDARNRPPVNAPGGITAGDWVALDTTEVVEVLPRRSALLRHVAGRVTAEQAVAANIDVILVVAALDVPLRPRKLERMLAAAWSSGAEPVVVLTKSDVCDGVDAARATVSASAAGAPVIAVSAVDGTGLDRLGSIAIPGRTMVLLGPSGAGKSTLLNRLAGHDLLATGDVRRDGKGRHTTTHRELLVLPEGAIVIDTPGVREFGLWDADEGIATAFADIVELGTRCRFSDCAHATEPGCAVRAAAAEDPAIEGRLESHRRLEREQRRLDRQQDGRALAEARKALRARNRMLRRQGYR